MRSSSSRLDRRGREHSSRSHPPRGSRQKRLKGRQRLVIYLGAMDAAKLELVRESVTKTSGLRPSVGIVVSAALSTLTERLFAC